MMADDTFATAARVQALRTVGDMGDDSQIHVDTIPVMVPFSGDVGPTHAGGLGVDQLRVPTSEDAWEALFLNWKAGRVTSTQVMHQLGDAVMSELNRRWHLYFDGGMAFAEERRAGCGSAEGSSREDGLAGEGRREG